LLTQRSYPSWLYPITRRGDDDVGAWDGIRPDSSFEDPGMNSFNHYAFGAVGDWMYQNIGVSTSTRRRRDIGGPASRHDLGPG